MMRCFCTPGSGCLNPRPDCLGQKGPLGSDSPGGLPMLASAR